MSTYSSIMCQQTVTNAVRNQCNTETSLRLEFCCCISDLLLTKHDNNVHCCSRLVSTAVLRIHEWHECFYSSSRSPLTKLYWSQVPADVVPLCHILSGAGHPGWPLEHCCPAPLFWAGSLKSGVHPLLWCSLDVQVGRDCISVLERRCQCGATLKYGLQSRARWLGSHTVSHAMPCRIGDCSKPLPCILNRSLRCATPSRCRALSHS